MKKMATTVIAVGLALGSMAAVELRHVEEDGRIDVHIRGEHFTSYNYGEEHRWPFLWPVYAEGQVGVTRNHPMGEDDPASRDHRHQKSIWTTYGDVNGHDFWRASVDRRTRTDEIESGGCGERAWIRAHKLWLRENGETKLSETQEVRFYNSPASHRVIDYIITFTACQEDITFGDDKEGLMAFRIRTEIEGRRAGVLTNAEGKQGERQVYGNPTPWMDYSGPVSGHGKMGIAMFDHPQNFRRGYWHVRNYGLAAVNPFGRRSVGGGEDGSYTLSQGESLALRYRLLIHTGDAETGKVAEHYQKYIEDASVTNPID